MTDLLTTAIAGLDAGDNGGPRWTPAAALARAVVAENLALVPLFPHGRGVRLAHSTARFQPQRHRRWMARALNNGALVAGKSLPVRAANQRQRKTNKCDICVSVEWRRLWDTINGHTSATSAPEWVASCVIYCDRHTTAIAEARMSFSTPPVSAKYE